MRERQNTAYLSDAERGRVIQKIRTKNVPRLREWVDPEKIPLAFPMSPSTVVWDFFHGCSLKRLVKKGCLKTQDGAPDVRMSGNVMRGSIIDSVITQTLERRMRGEEDLTEKEIDEAVYDYFIKFKDEYDLNDISNKESWLERIIGTILAYFANAEYFVPRSTQRTVHLYIGDATDIPVPVNGVLPRETRVEDWATGRIDWDENIGTSGVDIVDLKVTARPTKRGLGKYKFQCFTYCSAGWQEGLDVKRGSIFQINPTTNGHTPVSEEFIEQDYIRVIQIYRAIRDHYLRVQDRTSDVIVPFRGAGKCTSFSCEMFPLCPAGGMEV